VHAEIDMVEGEIALFILLSFCLTNSSYTQQFLTCTQYNLKNSKNNLYSKNENPE